MPQSSYRFEVANLSTWDDDVHRHARQFREVAGRYPNRLEGAEETLDKIDRLISQGDLRHHVRGDDGRPPEPHEPGGLDAFCTSDYHLEIWIDDDLPVGTLALACEPASVDTPSRA